MPRRQGARADCSGARPPSSLRTTSDERVGRPRAVAREVLPVPARPQVTIRAGQSRAAVRGKVEGFLLRQPEVPAAQRAEALARSRRYFELACRYACLLYTSPSPRDS